MKYLARSIELPIARITQSVDSTGKPQNLSRFNQYADDDYLKDLSADIKRNGQIEPCCVRIIVAEDAETPALPINHDALLLAIEAGDIRFALVTGNNRFKAVQMFGGKTVLCNIIDGSQAELLNVAISENLSKPLSPVDYAISYLRMTLPETMGGAGLKPQSVASRCNVSLGTVRNHLRLLELPRTFQQALHDADQNTGMWAKDKDGEKMNKLRPTKALQLLDEARKYAATIIDEKADPEGFTNHVNLALGRVYTQFVDGYQGDAGPKVPAGFWRLEAIWPEGTRKPETTQNKPDVESPQATQNTNEAPPTSGGIKPQGDGETQNLRVSPEPKPPKKEKVEVVQIATFIGGLRKDLVKAVGMHNPVAMAAQALDVFLAHMEKLTLDQSERIEEYETALSAAWLKQALEHNKVLEQLQEYGSIGKGKAAGK